MRSPARFLAILALMGAAAIPASAYAEEYCQTVEYDTSVTGPHSNQYLCGRAEFVLCQHAGKGGVPPTVLVEACVPTPFPVRGEI